MAKGKNQTDSRYEALKRRLWNRPRALKLLEQMENDRVSSAMLEDVAGRFLAGQSGEAEIQAAAYSELLRNSDPKAILSRVANFRSLCAKVQLNLSWIADEIDQFKSWEAHQAVGYEDWMEFSEEVLGLSDKVIDALLLAREQVSDIGLNQFLQVMIKGYVAPLSLESELITGEKTGRHKSDRKSKLQDLKARLEWAEFQNGELVRANQSLEDELIKVRAEKSREIQKRDALISKLSKGLHPNRASEDPSM